MKNKISDLTLFKDIGQLLTLQPAAEKQGRRIQEQDLGLIPKAAIVVKDGQILWLGPQSKIPKQYQSIKNEMSLDGQTVLPGFVECHTHTVFAGSRSAEFELRQQGVSYQEIAQKGGGILSTVKNTRKASASELATLAQTRVDHFIKQGVTTLEIKTGYGLTKKSELKCLDVINSLKGPEIVSTFLAAHAIPPEFGSAEQYIDHLITFLPVVRKKTNRLDIWIENGFFNFEVGKKYFEKAKKLNFDLIVHADQLTLSGGTDLAVRFAARSADHVIQIKETEIKSLAKSDTTAVLLPMADLYMKCEYPPARRLIDAGARVALATDFNPGSCPSQDLSAVGLLARLQMKMTLPEVIAAYTVGASYALNLQDSRGSLAPGKRADFISIASDWTDLFYSIGNQFVVKTYSKGRQI